MDEMLTIELPCWNCGIFMTFSFRMFNGVASYEYCGSCRAGFELTFNDRKLSIDTLSYEG